MCYVGTAPQVTEGQHGAMLWLGAISVKYPSWIPQYQFTHTVKRPFTNMNRYLKTVENCIYFNWSI